MCRRAARLVRPRQRSEPQVALLQRRRLPLHRASHHRARLERRRPLPQLGLCALARLGREPRRATAPRLELGGVLQEGSEKVRRRYRGGLPAFERGGVLDEAEAAGGGGGAGRRAAAAALAVAALAAAALATVTAPAVDSTTTHTRIL